MNKLQAYSAILSAILAGVALAKGPVASAAEAPSLQLEDKAALGDVRGRIDHMAVDLARHRLFVAALGNDSLAVVDLVSKQLGRLINGLREPQGVAYDRATDTVYVANAGDGSLRLFNGRDLSPVGRIDLGSDADNVRVDAKVGQVFVGYGDGALAVIDAATRSMVASVSLPAHPESFQIDQRSDRIFVNLPRAGTIDVIDRIARRKVASWRTEGGRENFAMVVDQPREHLLVAFRRPAQLGVFSLADGSRISTVPTCGDVDDLFLDPKRDRIYVSCGDGFVDVLAVDGDGYRKIDRIRTAAGARTSLFVPELDRLLVAAPARHNDKAAILMFRPSP